MADDLRAELQAIKQRNLRVEGDKAWETSRARRAFIAVITYLVSFLVLILINAPNPELTALVPATAYVLSTLTLPFFKKWWVKKVYRK